MKMLSKSVAAACFALAWSMAGAGDAQTSDKPQFGAWGLDLSAMDKQVLPGNDFNRYASGAWLARTQIPADKPMASLRYLMTDRTEARLHELMDKGAATASQEPRDWKGRAAPSTRCSSTRRESTSWAQSRLPRNLRPFAALQAAMTS